MKWLIDVGWVVVVDVDGPTSTGKSVIIRVEEGAISVDVGVVVVVVRVVSVLWGMNGFRFVRDGVKQFVVGVFLPRGVICSKGRVVWAYAGVLPRVVFSDDAKLVSSEVTVVPTGLFYGVVNFAFGALA